MFVVGRKNFCIEFKDRHMKEIFTSSLKTISTQEEFVKGVEARNCNLLKEVYGELLIIGGDYVVEEVEIYRDFIYLY